MFEIQLKKAPEKCKFKNESQLFLCWILAKLIKILSVRISRNLMMLACCLILGYYFHVSPITTTKKPKNKLLYIGQILLFLLL